MLGSGRTDHGRVPRSKDDLLEYLNTTVPMLYKYVPTFLGLVFAWSGVYKTIHPGEATLALQALGASITVAEATILLVACLELYLAMILVFRMNLQFALRITTVLLI